MKTLVLLRHGQSQWNLENRFTGWVDVDLTDQGRAEAIESGRLLKEGGYDFDVVHTSLLKRAIRTMWLTLSEMDRMWLPVHRMPLAEARAKILDQELPDGQSLGALMLLDRFLSKSDRGGVDSET